MTEKATEQLPVQEHIDSTPLISKLIGGVQLNLDSGFSYEKVGDTYVYLGDEENPSHPEGIEGMMVEKDGLLTATVKDSKLKLASFSRQARDTEFTKENICDLGKQHQLLNEGSTGNAGELIRELVKNFFEPYTTKGRQIPVLLGVQFFDSLVDMSLRGKDNQEELAHNFFLKIYSDRPFYRNFLVRYHEISKVGTLLKRYDEKIAQQIENEKQEKDRAVQEEKTMVHQRNELLNGMDDAFSAKEISGLSIEELMKLINEIYTFSDEQKRQLVTLPSSSDVLNRYNAIKAIYHLLICFKKTPESGDFQSVQDANLGVATSALKKLKYVPKNLQQYIQVAINNYFEKYCNEKVEKVIQADDIITNQYDINVFRGLSGSIDIIYESVEHELRIACVVGETYPSFDAYATQLSKLMSYTDNLLAFLNQKSWMKKIPINNFLKKYLRSVIDQLRNNILSRLERIIDEINSIGQKNLQEGMLGNSLKNQYDGLNKNLKKLERIAEEYANR